MERIDLNLVKKGLTKKVLMYGGNLKLIIIMKDTILKDIIKKDIIRKDMIGLDLIQRDMIKMDMID